MSAWVSMVAVAVQGTGRRPPDRAAWLGDLGEPAAVLGGGPEEALLDAAALATVARRAGAQAHQVPPAAESAPRDDRPVVPVEAIHLATTYPETAGELIRLAAHLGLRLPATRLPWLLDLPTNIVAADAVRIVAGPTGEWLADQNPRWRRRLDRAPEGTMPEATAAGGPVATDPDTGEIDDTAWREGTLAVRIAWLARLRADDPEAAQAYIRAALAPRGEPAAVKERVIGVLHSGRHPDDEAVLEACLDATARGVRAGARAALAARPESAFVARMHERFRTWVQVGSDPLELRITLPGELDSAAVRDGLELSSAPARRAALVSSVLDTVPLAEWARFGSPEHLLTAPVGNGLGPAVEGSWIRRACVERDPTWALALIRRRGPVAATAVTELARVLAPAARDAETRALLPELFAPASARRPPGTATPFVHSWFQGVPFPLPDDVCAVLIDGLPTLTGERRLAVHAGALVRRIGQEQPPQFADQLTAVAPLVPPHLSQQVQEAARRHLIRARVGHLLRASRAGGSAPGEPSAVGGAG